ncbi:tape measure protein [Gordonia alkaliphila]|uniref:Tape measure protein n=1 Tax=Gordonia alkaliphila TaxID=1053547 RepID=A0ABP8ZK24_9ACTN
MAVNLMTAYVEVVPSLKGFHKPVKQAMGDIGTEADKAGRDSGSRFSNAFGKMTGGLGKAIKWGGVGAAAAAGGIAAKAFVGGFNRLNNMDQAEAKLKGLGRSSAEITSIMGSVSTAVDGTAFSLDQAANAAAIFSTSGVKAGDDMTRAMKLLADTTAQAGSDFGDMGPIFTKIIAQGELTTETFDQLNERGTGVGEALSKHLGIPLDQIRDKAAGIKFDDFATAMEKNIGGAAKKAGDTFKGSFDNMMTSFSKLGAVLLTPVFNALPAVFDKIKGVVADVSATVGGMFAGGIDTSPLEKVKTFFTDLWNNLKGPLESIGATFREDVMPIFTKIGDFFTQHGDKITGTLSTLGGLVGGAVATAFNILAGALNIVATSAMAVMGWIDRNRVALAVIGGVIGTLLLPYLTVLAVAYTAAGVSAAISGVKQVAAWVTTGAGAVTNSAVSVAASYRVVGGWIAMGGAAVKQAAVVVAGWVSTAAKALWGAGVQAAQGAVVVASWVAMGAKAVAQGAVIAGAWVASVARAAAATAATIAYAAAQGVVSIATGVWTVAQWALNSAFLANPLTWVVVGIMALIAVVVLIATKTTWFQTLWNKVWNGIKAVANVVWTAIKGYFMFWIGLYKKVGEGAMWLWNSAIVPAWNGIKAAFQIAADFIGGVVESIKQFFQGVADKAGQVKDWIVEKWDALVGFFTSLPGRVTSALGSLWDGLKDGFKGALNWIIDAWNNFKIEIKLPSILGGKQITIDTPNLPRLAGGGVAGRRRNGQLYGPGTGTSDSILGVGDSGVPTAWVSSGEFVVNAKATKRWLPLLTALNGGAGPGSGVGLPAFADGGLVPGAALAATGGEGGLKPISVLVRRLIQKLWPEITDIGGYRASDPFPDHPSGQALDIMISDVGLGDAVKAWLMDNKSAFDLDYTIWQQKYEPAAGGGNVMEDRGSPTQNHMDHIHALFGQIGAPPNVNPDVVPEGIKWPAGKEPAPAATDVPGVMPDTPAAPMDTPAPTDTGIADTGGGTSWSAIVGNAASEQFKDLMDTLGLKDDPSWLSAYGQLKDNDPATADDKGPGTLDPEAEAAHKTEFEDAQLAAKRKHEDELAQLDSDFQKKIDGTKDAAQKRRYREELAAEKRRLKREHEDRQRAAKREYETQKRKRAADAKSGSTLPSPGSPAEPGTPMAAVPADPNTPPAVNWSQGMGAEPWRPVLEWGIKRVGKGLTTAAAQLDAGVAQIKSESGGDPSIAQQIVDVNGTGEAAGVGLLQIIPGTWAANRDPALPDDRRNGPANIVGALRYYVGRYGPDLTKMWGKGHGYKTGGYTGNAFGVDDVAGVVHGQEFVINAAATRQWRPALEAINAGATPAAADRGQRQQRGAFAPVTNATFRDERAYYQRQRRDQQLVAARMK